MGKVVLKLGDDISTDVIYPGRYMATVLPTETPQFAFADDADFNTKLNQGHVPRGSVIVAGANFGCGSSREQAASTLRGHELTVVARSFARIFLQNAINLGVDVVTCETIEAAEGDELKIVGDTITNGTTGTRFRIQALPQSRRAVIEAGGLIPYTRQRVLEEHSKKTG